MSITLSALQKQRRDTAANWTAENPTLLAGEIGLESDTGYWKVGNGSSAWNSLAYVPGLGAELPVSRLADGTARQLLQTAANGTDVEWTSNVDVPGTLDVTGAATFDNNVTVQGDLTVNGTEVIINTQTLEVEDKNVIIGKVATPTDLTADGGGITLKGTTDKTINWIDATDAWTLSEHVNIANGKEYRINGTKVLDATSLGSSVLITSANITDGTIVNGDVSASAAIAGTKISPDFGSQNVTTTGTATAAALIPSGSSVPTNGVYLPSANNVAISTNGVGRLFVDSSGRLGLGTGSPGANLEVVGGTTTTGPGAELRLSAADQTIAAADEAIGSITFNSNDVSSGMAGYFAKIDAVSNRIFDGDLASGMHMRFFTGTGNNGANTPVERLRITSGGLVGIGTQTPSSALTINNDGIGFRIERGSAVGYVYHNSTSASADLTLQSQAGAVQLFTEGGSNQPIKFITNGTERARIDSSGRLLVGTSSTSNNIRLLVQGSPSYNGSVIQLANNGTAPANGDDIGVLQFSDANHTTSARILVQRDGGTWTSNSSMPTRLVFSTTPDGSATPVERMRITSGGAIYAGSTSAGYIGSEALVISRDNGTTKWSVGPYNGQPTHFYVTASSGTGVLLNGTAATSWSSNSDERLKTDLAPIENAKEKVLGLRAVTGRYKTDSEDARRPFLIAQDVQKVLPEAVSLTRLPGDPSETEYLALAYTEVIPLLVAAIKELSAGVDALKAQLQAS